MPLPCASDIGWDGVDNHASAALAPAIPTGSVNTIVCRQLPICPLGFCFRLSVPGALCSGELRRELPPQNLGVTLLRWCRSALKMPDRREARQSARPPLPSVQSKWTRLAEH